MVGGLFQRWGKARRAELCHLLPFHMLDVAAVLEVGLRRRPELLAFLADGLGMARDQARAMLLTVLALHDLGKVAACFQAKNPAAAQRLGLTARQGRSCPHDALGQAILLHLLHTRPQGLGLPEPLAGWKPRVLLFALSTGHHGRPPRRLEEDPILRRQGLYTPGDLDVAAALVRAMADLFGWHADLPDEAGLKRLSPLLNSLFSLCDWLGSANTFAYREEPQDLRTYHQETALVTAERVLDEIQPSPFRRLAPRRAAGFADLFPRLARPSPLQGLVDRLFTKAALPDGPLLTVIEDLPGSGKTEAGDLIIQRLLALRRADGAYVGLPTMVMADAAFARKFTVDGAVPFGDQLFETRPQVVLAHSRRHRNRAFGFTPTRAGVEEGEGFAVDWFGRSSRRALLTELGVGTVDQALAGALRARYASLRLAGLWRKVLLVDEVHAYDDYMCALLESLLRWQGMMGAPVVLMSATLPAALRNRLVQAYAAGAGWQAVATMAGRSRPGAYPLLTLVSAQGVAQHPLDPVPGPGTRPVRFQGVQDEAVVEGRIRDWLAAGRSVLWFRNTVDDAVAAWQRLADCRPLLYHARYLAADRVRLGEALLNTLGKDVRAEDRRGRLVIATQAAEQSLDLDADELVTDLAPADTIVQRLGRRRRHARTADGRLAGDGVEGRPDSPVLLHMPPLENPGPDWYARHFRRAAKVYDNDARLWLTARYLLRPQDIPDRTGQGDGLVLAQDVRPLLEAVYADTPTGVPTVLLARHDRSSGNQAAERQQGREARLAFRDGWLEDWRAGNPVHGGSDDKTDDPRTRLIDSHTVILAEQVDGVPRLMGAVDSADDNPLEAAECRCPMPLGPLPEQRALADQLAATLTDRWAASLDPSRLVFLTRQADGVWRGAAMAGGADNANGAAGRRSAEYCPVRGLRLVR